MVGGDIYLGFDFGWDGYSVSKGNFAYEPTSGDLHENSVCAEAEEEKEGAREQEKTNLPGRSGFRLPDQWRGSNYA